MGVNSEVPVALSDFKVRSGQLSGTGMSSTNEAPVGTADEARSKSTRGHGNVLDDRLRAAKSTRNPAEEDLPDHWTFLLGEIALYLVHHPAAHRHVLTFFFKPSMSSVIYPALHQARWRGMSEAYAST